MTNTKFRKRALLSSVAMLLVALVALGSATFAWFAANPKANAAGLKLKTTAATGLVVKTDTDHKWSHAAALNAEETGADTGEYASKDEYFNLTPVSQDQSDPGKFYTADAKKSTDYRVAKDTTFTSAGVTAGHTGTENAYAESVYFRLSDGSSVPAAGTQNVVLTGVTITKRDNAQVNMDGCIRVAVASGSNILGTYALNSASPNGVVDSSTDTSTADATDSELASITSNSNYLTKITAGASTIAVNKIVCDASTLSASASESSYPSVTVYVWLDGQDTNCYSDKVGSVNAAGIIDNIQVDFELKPAA